MNKYIGHESQILGIEEHRLVGGKGDGMRLFQVRNGKGLEFTVTADRCADISRLSFNGINMSYFSPSGYVAPAYYDGVGSGFLKSFTAGFLTTCGLNAVGSPCEDAGEILPLHGTIGNTPAEHIWWEKEERELNIQACIKDEGLFSHKLVLNRKISCSLDKNEITLTDWIKNCGFMPYPVMIMYHINIGYPLLSENAELYIHSQGITPRNEHAAASLDTWNKIIAPQPGFEEQCYFHQIDKKGFAAIYNSQIGQGLAISYDPRQLPFFTEWKMLGERDYVVGLEPGNAHPDGRDKMREEGSLVVLAPGEDIRYEIKVNMIEDMEAWRTIKKNMGAGKC